MKKTLALILLLAWLTVGARAATLTWNGSWNDMTWNTENGNWLLNGAHAVYANGNDVVFGDTGNGYVSLSGELAPSSVLVKSDNYYFFCDDIGESNKLTGTMQLTKEGEGKLTIQTANDYTGGTIIKGGTLQMGNENALGSDDVTLMGGTLNLGGCTLSNNVNVNGTAHITNGTVSGNLNLADGASFTWNDAANLQLTGSVTLGNDAWFALNGQTLSASVNVIGDNATIQGGDLSGDLTIGAGNTLELFGDITGTGVISLEDRAQLHWTGQTFSGSIKLGKRSAIDADFVSSNTTIKTRESADSALLEKVSVSDGLIAGTDRQASLADGLEIESTANLMIKNMTITADNKISVGQNTITLNDVTIKLTQAHYDETEGVFLFDLGTLINCDLVMQNVLLDASDLSLPEGFDPATTTVVFDFGDDVTIKQATGLDMRLGNYWSPSLNLDQQGQVIFTKLVPTPEPTTGTLGLLALAALAARRRKK